MSTTYVPSPETELPSFDDWPVKEKGRPKEYPSVATEAKRLDRLFPGWHLRVNTDTLDLAHPSRCILGQAAYERLAFVKRPIGFAAADRLVRNDAQAGGAPYYPRAYCARETRNEWLQEIDKRFA